MFSCQVFLLLLPFCVGIPEHYTANPITWADPSDPVVNSALAKLGPEWRLADGGLTCRDILDNCEKVANLTNCLKNTGFMLNYCRWEILVLLVRGNVIRMQADMQG